MDLENSPKRKVEQLPYLTPKTKKSLQETGATEKEIEMIEAWRFKLGSVIRSSGRRKSRIDYPSQLSVVNAFIKCNRDISLFGSAAGKTRAVIETTMYIRSVTNVFIYAVNTVLKP